jgi:hypothetical protein
MNDSKHSEFYKENLDSLRRNNPALAGLVDAVNPENDDPEFPGCRFVVRDAHNGQPTMFAVNGETEAAIHSVYDPAREASDQASGAISKGSRNYFVILGFGLGYAVDKLAEEVESEDKILVIEPHIQAFRLALSTRDLRKILSDSRIVITIGTNVENSVAAFFQRYSLVECTGVGFVELAGRSKLPSAKFYADFLERLKGVLITTGGNLQTLMLMAWTYQKNTMASLEKIIDHPPVRTLFSAFEKKPAIIISAGPSLQKNIGQLKEYEDKAVLIAVDTSLRPLLAAGIEPHLVCTGDPQEANWKHLRGTVASNAHLVAEPMTYPSSLDHFKGRLFIASYGDKVMSWLGKFIPDVGYVMCWGSVATMAFDLARKMGCDPIIFVGQDLSFPGGRTYVQGTYFEDEEKQDMSVEAFEKKHITYTLADIYGQPVKTNRQMFAYKEWFRTEFSRTKVRVINCTEGGILKENCEIMPFREAASSVLAEKFDAMEIIRQSKSRFEKYDIQPLLKGLFENIASIKRCIDICEKGIKEIRNAMVSAEKMDTISQLWGAEVIKELDQLRFQLLQEQALKDFLETANQTGVLNFKRAYKKLNQKQFSRVVFREAMDLFTDLFMSTGRVARGVLPFFVLGFKHLATRDDAGNVNAEELCLTKS